MTSHRQMFFPFVRSSVKGRVTWGVSRPAPFLDRQSSQNQNLTKTTASSCLPYGFFFLHFFFIFIFKVWMAVLTQGTVQISESATLP